MKLKIRSRYFAFFVAACIGWTQSLAAQNALLERQAAIIERLFLELDSVTEQRQLFNLWMADLLLDPDTEPALMIGVEDAVASGALSILKEVAGSDDAEIASLADELHLRILNVLDLDAAADAAVIVLENSDSETLAPGNFDRWLVVDLEAGLEYSILSLDCTSLSALALEANAETSIAGGTYTDGRFVFIAEMNDRAYIRVRTPNCDDYNEITISAAEPRVRIEPAASSRQAQVVTTAIRYLASFTSNAEQWMTVDIPANRHFLIEAIPFRDVDTVLTIYESDGTTQLATDDDGGNGLGSQLDFASDRDTTLLVKVHELGGNRGEFEFLVTEKVPPIEIAEPADIDDRYSARIERNGEHWWRVDTQAGRRYLFESYGIDTVMTLFAEDGITEIEEDDDGGRDSGSLIEFASDEDSTVLARVREYSGEPGEFEFVALERLPPIELAQSTAIGNLYSEYLEGNSERWWRLDAQAGQRYVLDAYGIDTVMTLYEENGITEIDYDDDGGQDGGSRLRYGSDLDTIVLVRITDFSGEPGYFDFVVAESESPNELATQASPGNSYPARIEEGEERWWRVDTRAGERYVFEAVPRGIDTVMTLYADDGVTEIDYDDDGGEDLGSRIDFQSNSDTTVLIRIHELDGAQGDFELFVTEIRSAF